MRWIPNKSFPHPVLSDGNTHPLDRDYVRRCFQPQSKMTMEGNGAKLEVSFNMSEESLLQLVAQGKAEYVVEVHCRDTYFREILSRREPVVRRAFAEGELHRHVEVSFYLVCKKDIYGHTSKNIHKEFGDKPSFDFSPGTVLAIAEPLVYWAELDAIQAIGSIFEVVPEPRQKNGFAVDWSGERIQILMDQNDFDRFSVMLHSKNMGSIALSSVYFPALLETLHVMRESAAECENKRWYEVLHQKLANQSIDLEDQNCKIFEIAQMLMDFPVRQAISDCRLMFDDSSEQ